MFGALKDLLLNGLVGIHDITGLDWAWNIVLLTVAVRVIILPLEVRRTRATLLMQKLQPHIKSIKDRNKSDRMTMNQEMMEFYRDNNFNPMASCFPLLLQMPIMIGLFFVLKDFAEKETAKFQDLRDAADLNFLGSFVPDITIDTVDAGWAGVVTILFYVTTQIGASKVMMATAESAQKAVAYILPVVFVPIVLAFPYGVLLYWMTTNVWTLLQTIILKKLINVDVDVVLPANKKGKKRIIPAEGSRKKQDKQKDSRNNSKEAETQPDDSVNPERPVLQNKRRKRR